MTGNQNISTFDIVSDTGVSYVDSECEKTEWTAVRDMPPLSEEEAGVIERGGTEPPFSGKYYDLFQRGIYICRRCGAELYRSEDKFKSECGWAAFDAEIPGAVTRRPDRDCKRIEILCAHCGAHLGHVFEGERLTHKNVRHCVNSTSLTFVPAQIHSEFKHAIFAGGCFWGLEDIFSQVDGVLSVASGYTGGVTVSPTYEQVCAGNTGHAEAVMIEFDPKKITYEALVKIFFESHDSTQKNRQGPDIGTQYRSEIFYVGEAERTVAERLIFHLHSIGIKAVTALTPASAFFPAEEYHQKYFAKHPEARVHTCHVRRAIDWEVKK